jgi:hypothetical protein
VFIKLGVDSRGALTDLIKSEGGFESTRERQ